MEYRGQIRDRVVVLDGDSVLPEGATVTVVYPPRVDPLIDGAAKRVAFPLVRSMSPGSVNLTNDRIAEILDDEDVAAGR